MMIKLYSVDDNNNNSIDNNITVEYCQTSNNGNN